jgi:hypothetical protein|tara:strand:- start:824 stop:1009 length:186 start_codon:yes stop_codon:yes gene_type:complete
MSKNSQPKYSNAGKGDKNRITNHKKYAENWDKIFGSKEKKDEKTITNIRGKGNRRETKVSD